MSNSGCACFLFVFVFVFVCLCLCVSVFFRVSFAMCTGLSVYVSMYVYVRICMYVCMCIQYVCMCVCVSTHTHTHTHTQNLTAHPCRPYYQQNATADVKPGSCPECQSKGPLFVNQAYHHLKPSTALTKPYQAEETGRSLSTRHLIGIISLVKIYNN